MTFYSVQFVPDWFVTQQRRKYLRDNNDEWYHNKISEWYDDYRARKAQKVQIKKEFPPLVSIHQGTGIGVCQKTKKKETEKLRA